MSYATKNATANSHVCGDCDSRFRTNQGPSQHQRKCQTRSNTCTDPKDAQDVWNVEASSQNSVTIEDNFVIPCTKYIRYKDCNFEKYLSTVCEKIVVL